jgi:23S rRNA (adenine2503-C2)-methyltransferase
MGIGEPMDNFENVLQFFRLLSDPSGYAMSLRHVTVSSCGIVPRIRQLADLKLGVTLSVSLHSSDNARRSEIMPINRKYAIEELLDACRYYFEKTGRRVTMEYAVIEQVNSSKEDAKQLAKRLAGMQCHVNLIPVNPIKERSFRSMRQTVERFQRELESLGVHATIRRTLGSDIQAACGQLRRDAQTQA